MLPRAQRKDALKHRKEIAEEMNLQKEQDFHVQLRMNAEVSITNELDPWNDRSKSIHNLAIFDEKVIFYVQVNN